MNRLQGAYIRLLVPVIALLALAALTACGGSGDGAGGGGTGDGAGGGEPISLTGNWSGTWKKTTPVPDQSGTIAATFTEGAGLVGGTITLTPDICDLTDPLTTAITGALIGNTLTYTFGPDGNNISATAGFPANPMDDGTYTVDIEYGICLTAWGGIFDLTKQP